MAQVTVDIGAGELAGQGLLRRHVEDLSVEHGTLIRERVLAAFLFGTPDAPRSLIAAAWSVRGSAP